MRVLYKSVLLLVSFMLLSVSIAWTAAQREAEAVEDYPSRPIQLIVPANPGGGTDVSARLLAKYLTPLLDTQVVITNMPGAGGTIAQDYVLDSDPDGYTVFYFHEAFVANRVHGLTDTTMRDDFATVGGAFLVDTVCLYSKDFETWDDMVAAAEEREVLFGSEVGAAFHIAFEAMKAGLGLDNLRFIDTGAVTPTLAAMEGDQIDIAMVPMGIIRDSVEADHLNVLAFLSTRERSSLAPDVPTMTELGVDVYMPKFFHLQLPPDTPQELVQKLRAAVREAAEDPLIAEEAREIFFTAQYLSPEEVYEMADAVYELMTEFAEAAR